MRVLNKQEWCLVNSVLTVLCNYLKDKSDRMDEVFYTAVRAFSRWNGRFRFHVHEWHGDFRAPENPPELVTAIEVLTELGFEKEIQEVAVRYNTSFTNVSDAHGLALNLLCELAPEDDRPAFVVGSSRISQINKRK